MARRGLSVPEASSRWMILAAQLSIDFWAVACALGDSGMILVFCDRGMEVRLIGGANRVHIFPLWPAGGLAIDRHIQGDQRVLCGATRTATG